LKPGFRLAVAFSAAFFMLGVYLPFWPVWLESRGLSPELIGLALGLGGWARPLVNPWIGSLADRTGRGRSIAVVLAVGVLVAYLTFTAAYGTGPLLALSLVLGIAFAPIVPLVDASAVRAAGAGAIDYGRVRRWGSVAFIVGSVGVGWQLERASEATILFVLIGAAFALVVGVSLVPPARSSAAEPRTASQGSVRALVKRRDFRLFLVTCAALHGSHAVLYAYGTPHWRAAGIEDSTIGWLWAEGVVAEIALFSLAPRVATRLSPSTLMIVAGVAGLIRWPVLAISTAIPWLVVVQGLHGLTFGATHLGAMSFIRERVHERSTTGATSLYSGIATGLAFGVGLPLAGVLYDSMSGAAYFVMAGVSAAGIVAATALRTLAGTRTDDVGR